MPVSPPAAPIVAISGGSGLIGPALARSLHADGIGLRRLVRRAPRRPDEIEWRPGSRLDPRLLGGVTAVVNLSGAPVGDRRWNEAFKRVIRDSRLRSTDTLARALAEMDRPTSVFVSASAIGYYGDTGDREVTEASPKGPGFFADVVRDWEEAAEPARAAGIRVVHPRSGLVVSSRGGAWARMFPLFRAGVGGRLGSGRQYWSWISLRDEVAALRFLMDGELAGPVNLTSPNSATNSQITTAMGEVLHRPTVLPVPAFALRAVLGEFSSEVLGSIRARPEALIRAGFAWQDQQIDDAIRAARSGW